MQAKRGLVSVIILSYKQFAYIYETIDSVLLQDYPAIEIVIADDGSPNFPQNEIVSYIEKNKRDNIQGYTLLHDGVNVGTVKNINNGIKHSSGEFIKIIAGDDTFYDGKVFSTQVEFLEKNPKYYIVTGKACECDEQMKPIYKEQVENTNKVLGTVFELEPKGYFQKCGAEHLFPMVTQALCFRRKFFDEFGLYDERYKLLEDPPMEKRVIINRIPISSVDACVIKHRADVGISANTELFSARRSQYYLDLANYVKNELLSRPQIFPHFKTKYRYKSEMFRYKMSIAKTKKERIMVCITNIDTVFFFGILRPGAMIQKIKIGLSGRK